MRGKVPKLKKRKKRSGRGKVHARKYPTQETFNLVLREKQVKTQNHRTGIVIFRKPSTKLTKQKERRKGGE